MGRLTLPAAVVTTAGARVEPSAPGDPAPQARSDRSLLQQAALGDVDSFTALFERHFAGTFSYAVRMLDGDEQLAHDATQNGWIKVWSKVGSYQGRSQVRTWLFSIVGREVLTIRRRRRPVVVDHETLQDLETGAADRTAVGATPVDQPEAVAVHRDLTSALSLALSELPWRQRASWVLREFEDMSYGEIADVLETSETVVRGQLHRARRTLALRMGDWR